MLMLLCLATVCCVVGGYNTLYHHQYTVHSTGWDCTVCSVVTNTAGILHAVQNSRNLQYYNCIPVVVVLLSILTLEFN